MKKKPGEFDSLRTLLLANQKTAYVQNRIRRMEDKGTLLFRQYSIWQYIAKAKKK